MLEDLGYKVILDAEVSLTMKKPHRKIKCKKEAVSNGKQTKVGAESHGEANQSRSRVA